MKLTSTKHKNYMVNTLQGFFFTNTQVKGFLATCFGALVYITGADPKVLEIIGMLLLSDLVMGILASIRHKTLSSDYLVTILYKTAMYLVLLMGTNWFITMCPYCSLLGEVMKFLIAAAELISIMENADLLGFKYAKRIIEGINNEVEKKLYKS